MIPYIGDISKKDALILAQFSTSAKNILEFGCGASTQVIAKYKDTDARFTSIDTSDDWIERTKRNLDLFKIEHPSFSHFNDFIPNDLYDFVFDDGVDHLRRPFAIDIWPEIAPGGILAFHDTRRAPDFRNVLEVLAHYQDEIEDVYFNIGDSNITSVCKRKAPLPYENWQITGNKQPWQLGYENPPEEFIKSLKND